MEDLRTILWVACAVYILACVQIARSITKGEGFWSYARCCAVNIFLLWLFFLIQINTDYKLKRGRRKYGKE